MRKIRLILICVITVVLYEIGLCDNIGQPAYINSNSIDDKIQAPYEEKNEILPESILYEVSEDNLKLETEAQIEEPRFNKENNDGPVVFLGDSITEGLSIYGYFPDSIIKGINSLNTVSAKEYVNEISTLHPSKLFILLGINDIWEGGSIADFINSYNELLLEFKSQTPQTRIYVETLLPVSTVAIERNSQIDNIKIDSANTELQDIVDKLDLNFVDVNSLLKDEDGNLKIEYSNDGVHLIDVYYPIWTNILDKYKNS